MSDCGGVRVAEMYTDGISDQTSSLHGWTEFKEESSVTFPQQWDLKNTQMPANHESILLTATVEMSDPHSPFPRPTVETPDMNRQPSVSLMDLNRKDKSKMSARLERTFTCIPSAREETLTEAEVASVLGLKRISVIRDHETGNYWVGGADDEHDLFLDRISSRGLPGCTVRPVDGVGTEVDRLEDILVEEIRSQRRRRGPQHPYSSQNNDLNPSPPHVTDPLNTQEDSRQSGSSTLIGELDEPCGPSRKAKKRKFRASETVTVGTETGIRSRTKHHPKRTRRDSDITLRDVSTGPQGQTPQPTRTPFGRMMETLPPELVCYIFQLCLDDSPSSARYNEILKALLSVEGVIREILEDNTFFWTYINSKSSDLHNEAALSLSNRRLLSIEGGPDASLDNRSKIQKLAGFLCLIKPHQDRWDSLSLVFPSTLLSKVRKILKSPAPFLQSLTLSMTNFGLPTRLAPRMRSTLGQDIVSSLDILGREAGSLTRVNMDSVPCLWDPSPFTSIIELSLTNGVQLQYPELLLFLRSSTNLAILRLTNIKFVGDAPEVAEEATALPHLKELVFIELLEPTGLSELYLSIHAPNSDILHLDLHPSVTAIAHPAVAERTASIVQKSLALNSNSLLGFRSNYDSQSASWKSQQEETNASLGPRPSFHICFRGTNVALASLLCSLVRGVQMHVAEMGSIVVDVGNCVTGAIAEPFDLELDNIVPTLFPDSFRELDVVEIRADVVDGYLQHLHELLARGDSGVWHFGSLRTMRLRAVPKHSHGLEVLPDASARCSLEEFASHLGQAYYDIGPGVAIPPGKEGDIALALHGSFIIDAATACCLEVEEVLSGVLIDHSNAILLYQGQSEDVNGD